MQNTQNTTPQPPAQYIPPVPTSYIPPPQPKPQKAGLFANTDKLLLLGIINVGLTALLILTLLVSNSTLGNKINNIPQSVSTIILTHQGNNSTNTNQLKAIFASDIIPINNNITLLSNNQTAFATIANGKLDALSSQYSTLSSGSAKNDAILNNNLSTVLRIQQQENISINKAFSTSQSTTSTSSTSTSSTVTSSDSTTSPSTSTSTVTSSSTTIPSNSINDSNTV